MYKRQPQISVSTEDAKVSTLKSNLSGMRSALEIYYAQHDNKYPGQTKDDGTDNYTAPDAAAAKTAMLKQLTQYTEISGKVAAVKSATAKYGPYIKGPTLPSNPFVTVAADAVDVECNVTADITLARAASTDKGWKYHFMTGVFYAGTAAHLAY